MPAKEMVPKGKGTGNDAAIVKTLCREIARLQKEVAGLKTANSKHTKVTRGLRHEIEWYDVEITRLSLRIQELVTTIDVLRSPLKNSQKVLKEIVYVEDEENNGPVLIDQPDDEESADERIEEEEEDDGPLLIYRPDDEESADEGSEEEEEEDGPPDDEESAGERIEEEEEKNEASSPPIIDAAYSEHLKDPLHASSDSGLKQISRRPKSSRELTKIRVPKQKKGSKIVQKRKRFTLTYASQLMIDDPDNMHLDYDSDDSDFEF